MKVYVARAGAFDRYTRAESSGIKIAREHYDHATTIIRRHHHLHHGGGHHDIYRGMLPDVCRCSMCVPEMARDTPGSPMPRPRDLGAGGGTATATLTSGAYHAAATDPALHDHALQQRILEVTYDD